VIPDLQHYTCSTGDVYPSPLGDIDPDILDRVREWTVPGKHRLLRPFNNYHVIVPSTRHGFFFTLYVGKDIAIVSCGVAHTEAAEAEIWPAIERMYLEFSDHVFENLTRNWKAPHMPDRMPWLAVVLLGPVPHLLRCCEWLGDWERCMAWAWLTGRGSAAAGR